MASIENMQEKAEDNAGGMFHSETGRIDSGFEGKQARMYDGDAEKAYTVQVFKWNRKEFQVGDG